MAKRWRCPLPRTGTSGTFSSTVASAGQQRGDWFGRTGFQRPCCAARAVSFGRESRSSSSLRRDVHLITTASARRSSAIKSPGQRSDLWPGQSARGRPVGVRAWVKRRLGERRPACRPSHSCPRPPRPYGGPAQGTMEHPAPVNRRENGPALSDVPTRISPVVATSILKRRVWAVAATVRAGPARALGRKPPVYPPMGAEMSLSSEAWTLSSDRDTLDSVPSGRTVVEHVRPALRGHPARPLHLRDLPHLHGRY